MRCQVTQCTSIESCAAVHEYQEYYIEGTILIEKTQLMVRSASDNISHSTAWPITLLMNNTASLILSHSNINICTPAA